MKTYLADVGPRILKPFLKILFAGNENKSLVAGTNEIRTKEKSKSS